MKVLYYRDDWLGPKRGIETRYQVVLTAEDFEKLGKANPGMTVDNIILKGIKRMLQNGQKKQMVEAGKEKG